MTYDQYVDQYADKAINPVRIKVPQRSVNYDGQSYADISNQIQTLRDGTVQYNLNKGYLELFPNWAVKQKAPQSYTLHERLVSLAPSNNSKIMTQVAKIYPMQFDPSTKLWSGDFIQKQSMKVLSQLKSNQQKYRTSNAVLSKQIGINRIRNQLPVAVANVIRASQLLTDTGVGPKRRGGIDLFAGRYFNPVTNRIDVLPKATKTLLNPLSYEQRLAYQQAKLLNTWNSYIQQQQRLTNLNKLSPQQFSQAAQKRIQTGLSKGTPSQSPKSLLSFYNKIKTSYIKFLAGVLPAKSPLYVIFPEIVNTKQLSAQFQQPLNPKQIESLKNILTSIGDQAHSLIASVQQRIQNSNLPPERKIIQKKRYVNSLSSLDWKSSSRIRNAVIQAYKATSIPVKIDTVQGTTEIYNKVKQNVASMKQLAFGAQIDANQKKGLTKMKNGLKKVYESQDFEDVTPTAMDQLAQRDALVASQQRYPYFTPVQRNNDVFNTRPISEFRPTTLNNFTYQQLKKGFDVNPKGVAKNFIQQRYPPNSLQAQLNILSPQQRSQVQATIRAQQQKQKQNASLVQPSTIPIVRTEAQNKRNQENGVVNNQVSSLQQIFSGLPQSKPFTVVPSDQSQPQPQNVVNIANTIANGGNNRISEQQALQSAMNGEQASGNYEGQEGGEEQVKEEEGEGDYEDINLNSTSVSGSPLPGKKGGIQKRKKNLRGSSLSKMNMLNAANRLASRPNRFIMS